MQLLGIQNFAAWAQALSRQIKLEYGEIGNVILNENYISPSLDDIKGYTFTDKVNEKAKTDAENRIVEKRYANWYLSQTQAYEKVMFSLI